MAIHPMAFVEPGAEIHEEAQIGPFCRIGPQVRVGPGSILENNVTVLGNTTVGEGNHFFPGAVIGACPQDITYQGEESGLIIGDYNTFREGVTVNTGTRKGDGYTVIGSHNLIMACCHIAHDCILQNHIVMANGVLLGGHVLVQDFVVFGGLAAVHHFVTIGTMAFVGGMTRVVKDCPPYMTVEGNPAKIWFVNTLGCKRHGLSDDSVSSLKEAHRVIFRTDGTWSSAFKELESNGELTREIQNLIRFLKEVEQGKQGRAREALRKDLA
ncbi:MAG: acyl-ACP--UDP-N-acetylglucosamine O-acyltransferase [Planctomycetota bacterium]|nr:acyl-ACP--UDP-N-acetylglucosamine O-acyltransferase [Planctomycetota bacterium]